MSASSVVAGQKPSSAANSRSLSVSIVIACVGVRPRTVRCSYVDAAGVTITSEDVQRLYARLVEVDRYDEAAEIRAHIKAQIDAAGYRQILGPDGEHLILTDGPVTAEERRPMPERYGIGPPLYPPPQYQP
jgi:hypothetical protein